MSNLIDIGIWAGSFVGGLLAIGMILMRLYRRTTKEISFVRTGFGGQRVIMNGGALVFPVLHEVITVNMNTLRLAVNRANDQALITRDRMRVDVVAEFYVRVQPTEDSIANAAQTLGPRTTQPDRLKELIEGKFVDALRSVAAEMSMETFVGDAETLPRISTSAVRLPAFTESQRALVFAVPRDGRFTDTSSLPSAIMLRTGHGDVSLRLVEASATLPMSPGFCDLGFFGAPLPYAFGPGAKFTVGGEPAGLDAARERLQAPVP